MFGKKKRTIREQQERISALEQHLETLTADNKRMLDRIIDVERRERGIGRTLNEATAAADNMLANAKSKSEELLGQAQTECDSMRREAEQTVDDAYRSAREIIREAEDEGDQKRDEMQQTIEHYAALLNGYDAMVQEQIQLAQDGMKRLAELATALHEAVPKLLNSDGSPLPGLKKPEEEEQPAEETPAEPEAEAPDLEPSPLNPAQERSFEEQLWTVDRIAKDDAEKAASDVDKIIDEILAATEDDA